MAIVKFKNVSKAYEEGNTIIDDLSLDIQQGGEFLTLLGPSGCGKTTLLKMINKLIDPNDGIIEVNDKALKIGTQLILEEVLDTSFRVLVYFPPT